MLMTADSYLRAVVTVRQGSEVRAYAHPRKPDGACLTFGGQDPITVVFDGDAELEACAEAIRDLIRRKLGAEIVRFPGAPEHQPEPQPPRAA